MIKYIVMSDIIRKHINFKKKKKKKQSNAL